MATKLTPARQAAIVKAVERGCHWAHAAQAGNVSERTLRRWRDTGQKQKTGKLVDFVAALADAEARAIAAIEEDLHAGLLGPQVIVKTKEVLIEGEVVELTSREIHGADRRVQLEYLARRFPKVYAKRPPPEERAAQQVVNLTRRVLGLDGGDLTGAL